MEKQTITVSVERELWNKIGVAAAVERTTKRMILDKALREYLEKKEG